MLGILWIIAIGIFACATVILAGRQTHPSSCSRLFYETTSFVPGIAFMLQINGYVVGMDNRIWTLMGLFYPVLYWILIWHQILRTRLRFGAGLFSAFLGYLLLATVIAIGETKHHLMSGGYRGVMVSLWILVLYAPLWFAMGLRVYGAFSSCIPGRPPKSENREAFSSRNEGQPLS